MKKVKSNKNLSKHSSQNLSKYLSQKLSAHNYIRLTILGLVLLWCLILSMTPAIAAVNFPVSHTIAEITPYTQRKPTTDGIGKVYLGREIARVMGHTGAGWLERPSREAEEAPSKLINALELKPDDVVADIGAGTGYLSFRIADFTSAGKVYAVDIQPEMLEIINYFQQEKYPHIHNLETILATPENPHLQPHSIDLVLMVDVYHELEYPQETIQKIKEALKPDGRIALVEYRAENPFVMIKRLHKMSQTQAKKEMQAMGLQWVETKNLLPQQHLMIFRKPDS